MDHSLPPHLDERFRWILAPGDGSHASGRFVLYWMRSALRGHENPALDAAICLARQNSLALLVYRELTEEGPYASDRHHAFILQGQVDLQRELRDRGIASYFHLQREGHRETPLGDLISKAAVLITEEMPVEPLGASLGHLDVGIETPIAAVDTACVVPAPLVAKPYTRAYQYRDATSKLYQQRVARPYAEQSVDCAMYDGAIPFEPLDLEDVSLASLIAKCDVDHSIAPVADTPGGSIAGYRRWNEFNEHGLTRYAKRRNDAATHDGVSRMSAYLHFGMVSPLRMAREADELGAEKYLDELLIWRELSFHFCYHHADVIESLDALPDWARQTLREHEGDVRELDCSWEQLARGNSGQPLWDACQRSLLKHGELHNNLRMTWGKALLPWVDTPARALRLAIDLNHRYALDGRDPSSYGGILWCFGQFDRPFSPEQPVFGSVRPRSIEDHQRRIDLERYVSVADRPIAKPLPRVAVIGAGIGGLIMARTLADHGLDVTIFEKSRGVGGRLATRRIPNDLALDHGAQYFTARDPRFLRYVQSWMHDGWAAPWTGRIVELKPGGEIVADKVGTPRFVGVPGMNAIAKHLAKDLSIRHETTIACLERDARGGWKLLNDQRAGCGHFDTVITNCPPVQASAIIDGHSKISDRMAQIRMRPCWAVILCAEALEPLDFEAAFLNEGPLSWIAHDGGKPGRTDRQGVSTWMLHASADWSEQHLEADPDQVERDLMDAFESAIGKPMGKPVYVAAHRWRYAIPDNPLPDECLWDSVAGLGACGDWCGGPRVEGAFLSGMSMAGTLLRQLTVDKAAHRDHGKMVQTSLF